MEWLSIHESQQQIQTSYVEGNENAQAEWTGESIALLELALSVHWAQSINRGKNSIAADVRLFFNLFGLKPGNFSSTYAVMRTRAGSRTKYLDELKAGLEQQMDEDDKKAAENPQKK